MLEHVQNALNIPYACMEPKVQLFSDTLNQKMHDLTMKPLFLCNDLPLNLCVRKLRIHNSLNYQNRISKNARGDLLFWLSVYP